MHFHLHGRLLRTPPIRSPPRPAAAFLLPFICVASSAAGAASPRRSLVLAAAAPPSSSSTPASDDASHESPTGSDQFLRDTIGRRVAAEERRHAHFTLRRRRCGVTPPTSRRCTRATEYGLAARMHDMALEQRVVREVSSGAPAPHEHKSRTLQLNLRLTRILRDITPRYPGRAASLIRDIIFNECGINATDIHADAATYTILMRACQQAGDMRGVLEAFDTIQRISRHSQGQAEDGDVDGDAVARSIAFQVIANPLHSSANPTLAATTADALFHRLTPSQSNNAYIHAIVLRAWLRASNPTASLAAYYRMRAAGFCVREDTLGWLIEVLVHHSRTSLQNVQAVVADAGGWAHRRRARVQEALMARWRHEMDRVESRSK